MKVRKVRALLPVVLVLLLGITSHSAAQVHPHERGAEECAKAKQEWYQQLLAAERVLTPNQENYDVKYYDIDIFFKTTGFPRKVEGVVTVRAEVLSASLDSMDLDLQGNLIVNMVTMGGDSVGTNRLGSVLTVYLDRTYLLGEEFEVVVDYEGGVAGAAVNYDSYGGNTLIWSLSEPYGARTWWPCKDWPTDKADSVDIHWNVPSGLIAASNGTLRSVDDDGTRATYHWHEGYPITTYLVSIAAYPYEIVSDWYHYGRADSMEVRYYIFPGHWPELEPTYSLTVPGIELFAQLFGEYPFIEEKYGHAEFTWGGGMEHQTCTSLGGWSEYLIIHELAHMWWGDMVTCDSFHDIWLNEGFAVYSEALWSEFTYGVEQYHADMAAAAYYGPGTIYVEDPEHENVFDVDLSYNKASWIPHMLRHVVGDSTFFDILDAYYADSTTQYATATTEEFRGICEEVSGRDLEDFFHQWVHEEYFPIYSYDWSYSQVTSSYEIGLTIDQLQTNHVFSMPIDVTVYTTSGETTLVVEDSLAHQEFTLTVDAEPTGVDLDRDNWILRLVLRPMPEPTFDRGILVVNGVHFPSYEDEIVNAYADSVFWGDHDITFWDVFQTDPAWYPANLPAPLGNGNIPPDTLKQFSAVVWVGNNYAGDLQYWADAPMLAYLEAGGNVLLMGRYGQSFVYPPLRDYLGITWTRGTTNTISDCIATHSGLVDMAPVGAQSYCAVFDTSLTTEESHLLFKETASFDDHEGLGVWRSPADGGTWRPDGGNFVFLSGRPYRWNHDNLRANVQYILDSLFAEPYDWESAVAGEEGALRFRLGSNRPNPFNPVTTIFFTLPEKAKVSLEIYDVTGRRVATLVGGTVEAGAHTVTWQGRDDQGRRVASGVYFYRLTSGDETASRKMVLMQ